MLTSFGLLSDLDDQVWRDLFDDEKGSASLLAESCGEKTGRALLYDVRERSEARVTTIDLSVLRAECF